MPSVNRFLLVATSVLCFTAGIQAEPLGRIYRDTNGELRLSDMIVYGRKNTAAAVWLDLGKSGVVEIADRISTSPNVPLNMQVEFAHNSTNLTASGKASVEHLGDALRFVNKNMHIEIQGHTDSLGSKTYNRKLSTARAKAVMFYLANSRGVKNPMSAIGLADDMPVATNSTQSGRAQNRRVTILNRNSDLAVSD